MTVAALIQALGALPEGANVFVSIGCEFAPIQPEDIELDEDGDVCLGDVLDEEDEEGDDEEDESTEVEV